MQKEYPQPTFQIFVSSLSLQAMISLGLVESPITGKKEKDLKQAKFLIDTLDMIKEKTSGNLTAEEKAFLEDALANLKINYAKQKEAQDDR